MRVLVTGASGFVGRNLCESLARNGVEIRATSRAKREWARTSNIQWDVATLPNSINDPYWSQVAAGVDAVVHLAGAVHDINGRLSATEYQRTNVDAALMLARICRNAGVSRFVFLSTIKVNGDRTDGVPFTSADAPLPIGPYACSKFAAETGLAQLDAPGGMRVVILRPPLVYGPFVGGNVLRLLHAVWRGWPIPCGRSTNSRDLLGVRNLCSLIHRVLVAPEAVGRTFLASDDEALTTRQLAVYIAKGLGRRARLVTLPDSVLRMVGRATGRSATVARLLDSLEVDMSDTMSILRWHPPYSPVEELHEMAQWYRSVNGVTAS